VKADLTAVQLTVLDRGSVKASGQRGRGGVEDQFALLLPARGLEPDSPDAVDCQGGAFLLCRECLAAPVLGGGGKGTAVFLLGVRRRTR
jgi:hypothetical protein